jgi:hypothetical protein
MFVLAATGCPNVAHRRLLARIHATVIGLAY